MARWAGYRTAYKSTPDAPPAARREPLRISALTPHIRRGTLGVRRPYRHMAGVCLPPAWFLPPSIERTALFRGFTAAAPPHCAPLLATYLGGHHFDALRLDMA